MSRNKNKNSFQVKHKYFDISSKVLGSFLMGFNMQDLARFPLCIMLHICHAASVVLAWPGLKALALAF
jgi:hypothetical protein